MKFFEAVIQTAKEWIKVAEKIAKYLFTKSNIYHLLWLVWLFFPFIVGVSVFLYTLEPAVLLVAIFVQAVWMAFWLEVQTKTKKKVGNVTQSGEEKK
jgi:apolipoprotein N-acyltransferase